MKSGKKKGVIVLLVVIILVVCVKVLIDYQRPANATEVELGETFSTDATEVELGETFSTDILEVTVESAALSYYASNKLDDTLYKPTDDSDTIYQASKGTGLLCLEFTVKNTDRASIDSSEVFPIFYVSQDKNEVMAKGYTISSSVEKHIDVFSNLDLTYSLISINENEAIANNTACILMEAGEQCQIRTFSVVEFEPDIDAPFTLKVSVPNSEGDDEMFYIPIE